MNCYFSLIYNKEVHISNLNQSIKPTSKFNFSHPKKFLKKPPSQQQKFQTEALNSKLTEIISQFMQIQIPIDTAIALIFFSVLAPWIWDYIYQNLLLPVECKICYGSGAIICMHCKGRGKIGGWITGEELCKCEQCEGKGKIKCGDCNGTGLWNSWLYTPSKDPGWGPRGNK